MSSSAGLKLNSRLHQHLMGTVVAVTLGALNAEKVDESREMEFK